MTAADALEDPRRAATARVFFALWPDPEVRSVLFRHGQGLQRALGGRLTREDSVHLTLLFLGDVPEDSLLRLHEAAAGVRFPPFHLTIDTAKCWRHNNIAWVGPGAMPAALADLAGDLAAAAGDAGFAVERRPFAAHVTLVRKATCRLLDLQIRVDWPVREFALVRSALHRDGSRYAVIARWPAGT
jgi:RNA 2',3'-cyclic 3'-phosphodiesterase